MSTRVDQIVEETKALPEDQVETLLERFLLSNYRTPDPALDPAWAAEIQQRLDDLENGREQSIPGDEVMARVRRVVGL